jgi:hypothetical protein
MEVTCIEFTTSEVQASVMKIKGALSGKINKYQIKTFIFFIFVL